MAEQNRAELTEKIRAAHERIVAKSRLDMENSLETLRLEMEFAIAEMSDSELAEMLRGTEAYEELEAGKS